jgi:hypothetical protein
VNFNIFSVQHSHQIWTTLKHCGQFWRLTEEQIPISNMSKATWRYSAWRIA